MLQPVLAYCQNPFAILVTFVFLVTWAGWYPLRRWRYRHIAGPFGLPYLGNLPQILFMDTTAYLQYVARKYGPICKIWFGTRPWIVISDPDLVRKLAFSCNARPDLDTYIHVLTGENRHLDLAGLLMAELAAHMPAIKRCITRWLPVLDGAAEEQRPVEVMGPLGELMLGLVGEIAYGVDFSAESGCGPALAAAVRDAFYTLHIKHATLYLPLQLIFPGLQPLIRFLAHHLPDNRQRRAMAARSRLADVSRTLMKQWRAAKATEERGGTDSGNEGGADAAGGKGAEEGALKEVGGGISASSFMAAMMEERRGVSGPERLSELEVIAQSINFIGAGFETSSTTTATILFLLASHPEVQQQAAEEAVTLGDRELTMEVLSEQIPYIDAVLRETLRLYPAGSFLPRRAKSDMDLGGGRVVPRGSYLALSIHNLQHDPAMWPQPSVFMPERHLPESGGALGPNHPAAWAAFGLGARMCVGHKLATMVTKATLATLLRCYSFRLAPCQRLPLRTRTGLTYGPADGVWLMVERRRAGVE